MKRIIILFAAAVACGMNLMAQTLITGTVIDRDNNPMMGVIVTPESEGTAVATDFDGKFEITVPEGTKLTFSSMGIKTEKLIAVDSMVVVMKVGGNTWNWRAQKWKHIFLAEYGIDASSMSTHSIGLRYGMCHYAGWFVGVRYMTSAFRFPKADYTMRDGVIDDSRYDWGTPVTKDKNINQFTVSAGLLWRMYIPLYGYAGVGYGYRMTEYQTTDNVWYKRAEDKSNLLTAEFGLIGDIRNFTISAGCELVFAGSIEIYPKIGIGFALPVKSNKSKKGGVK